MAEEPTPAPELQQPAPSPVEQPPVRVLLQQEREPVWKGPFALALVAGLIAFVSSLVVQTWMLRHQRDSADKQFERERAEQRALFEAEHQEQDRVREAALERERSGVTMVLQAEMALVLQRLCDEAENSYVNANRGYRAKPSPPEYWALGDLYRANLNGLGRVLAPELVAAVVEFNALMRDLQVVERSFAEIPDERRFPDSLEPTEARRGRYLFRALQVAERLEGSLWRWVELDVSPEQKRRRSASHGRIQRLLVERGPFFEGPD